MTKKKMKLRRKAEQRKGKGGKRWKGVREGEGECSDGYGTKFFVPPR